MHWIVWVVLALLILIFVIFIIIIVGDWIHPDYSQSPSDEYQDE